MGEYADELVDSEIGECCWGSRFRRRPAFKRRPTAREEFSRVPLPEKEDDDAQ